MTIAICCFEWWCMSATALGSKVTKVRHHRVGGDRPEGDAGHEVERGKVVKFSQRPASSEASPDRSK